MSTHTLEYFLSSGNKEVIDRLSYARDIIGEMIVKKQKRMGGG